MNKNVSSVVIVYQRKFVYNVAVALEKKCTRLAIRVYKINFECWIHALMHFYHASSWLIPSRRYRAYNEDHSRARFRSRLRLLRVLLNNLSHRKKRAINYIHATVEWNAWTCQLSGNFVITMVARGSSPLREIYAHYDATWWNAALLNFSQCSREKNECSESINSSC